MSQVLVIRTIVGLIVLVGLAYLAGHPKVQVWEEKLRISQVITTGFPFVLLGLLARRPAISIATAPVIEQLTPFLGFALGWIGLVAGFRFDARLVSGLPPGAARAVAFATSVPFALVVGLTGVVLLSISGQSVAAAFRDPVFLRDAFILGSAGAMTAKTSARLLRRAESAGTLGRIIRIEELAGIFGLALVGAYFRPHASVSWQIPGTAWFLLTVGLGATVGVVMYAILQYTHQGRPEFVVLTLGSVSFSAGVAGYLRLSPLVVTFVAGVLLANVPGDYRGRLGSALHRLERPVYLLSLFVIGALWDISDWRGWVLTAVFVAARLIGKGLGARLAARSSGLVLDGEESQALAVSPMGPLAVAMVVNAQLLYPGESISLIASAVIGGAVATEALVQLMRRRPPAETTVGPPAAAPGDELARRNTAP